MNKLILCLALLLTGCVSAQERLRQNAAIDDSKCRSYGAEVGTPAYVRCRTQLAATRAPGIGSSF
jgi:starvation-inducible outer membrane lipoprotein